MKLVLFNLKAYLDVEGSVKLAAAIGKAKVDEEIVVAPSQLSLQAVSKKLRGKKVSLCAQDFSYSHSYGAHTGDVLLDDIKKIGCRYAMIGHSEVRHREAPGIGDSNELVSKKIGMCLKSGIVPILCFGETAKEKDSGKTYDAIRHQLESAFSGIDGDAEAEAVLAYEPVWAISSAAGSKGCDIGYVRRIEALARKTVKSIGFRFVYGGSVDAGNISDYLSDGMIDGVLIGRAGASLGSMHSIFERLKKP
ncbi:MAG: triose-phosphate isomerase [Candidatus Micrarchaeaceae archaeon]